MTSLSYVSFETDSAMSEERDISDYEFADVAISSSNRDRGVEANGLLLQVESFQFILCLFICEKIFGIVSKLSELLQAEKIDYYKAALQIEATISTFNTIRSDVWWNKLHDKAVAFANNHSISCATN